MTCALDFISLLIAIVWGTDWNISHYSLKITVLAHCQKSLVQTVNFGVWQSLNDQRITFRYSPSIKESQGFSQLSWYSRHRRAKPQRFFNAHCGIRDFIKVFPETEGETQSQRNRRWIRHYQWQQGIMRKCIVGFELFAINVA